MADRSHVWICAGAALSFAACIYCALWILSAASLASGHCGDGFSLFAVDFRCRQAHIAMLLTLGFGVLFSYFVWRAIRAVRRSAA